MIITFNIGRVIHIAEGIHKDNRLRGSNDGLKLSFLRFFLEKDF